MIEEIAQKPSITKKKLWVWMLFFAVAFLPFLLRLGIDTSIIKRQAVLEIYRSWLWSPEGRKLLPKSDIIYVREQRYSMLEDFFETQLQRDFRLTSIGNHPRVRAFFADSQRLFVRVEVWDPKEPSRGWQPWFGQARMANNGILLGPWFTIFLMVLGYSLSFSLSMGYLLSLFWLSSWNLLSLPSIVGNFFYSFGHELWQRIQSKNWIDNELSRLPEFSAALWLLFWLLLFFVSRAAHKKEIFSKLKVHHYILLSFLVEPLAIWSTSLFATWSDDASWWKIYLGSFFYRFFTFSVIFIMMLQPKSREKFFKEAKSENLQWHFWGFIAPFVFLISKGWAWLNSVLLVGIGDSLLRMKVFMIAGLLGFLLGSRLFAIWLATLSMSLLLPPTRGHWHSAALCGLLFDGLFLGWCLSPYKVWKPSFVFFFDKSTSLTVFAFVWILGVFLSSVGINVVVSWMLLLMAIWAYLQLKSDRSRMINV
jgi:hypothetical protein